MTILGTWTMVFGFWQNLFLDCNGCPYGNVFWFCSNFCFINFGFLSGVLFDFWRNSHSGIVKTAFFMVWDFFWGDQLRDYWTCFKLYGFWSIFFFITLTRVFPQQCVNCILNVHKIIWRDFVSLKTPGMFYQFRIFGNRIWAPLQKKLCPYFQNSIRGDQSNNLSKNKFFKEVFFYLEVSDINRKLFRFLAKKTDRKRNILWFLGVNGSILKKDGFFKTNINKLCRLLQT